MPNLEALRNELMAQSEEFRGLVEEHRRCEAQLQELHAKSLLSQEDEIQEKQIKVHKLALKDRMELLLREHRTGRAGA
ncbi:MAG: DUF465 domain-containing protein [Thermoanaerobaculia bacterium]|nr:DUF465 domain-containing protein [Thermoanaerobaculia bacterium]MCZ7650763.1 DUF465 domain-containing protein [Thermoanaerobaculia bacterium]